MQALINVLICFVTVAIPSYQLWHKLNSPVKIEIKPNNLIIVELKCIFLPFTIKTRQRGEDKSRTSVLN